MGNYQRNGELLSLPYNKYGHYKADAVHTVDIDLSDNDINGALIKCASTRKCV